MGKHAEWRRIAKKLRRKRIRQKNAQERDQLEEKVRLEVESSPSYRVRLENEEKAELLQLQEEKRIHDEQEANWLEREKIAQKEWRELQNKLELLKKERAIQNARIREEWEQEKKKLKEAEDAKKREIEEELKRQEKLQEEINHFIEFGGSIPEHLKIDLQTNPGKIVCPFFNKTSTCRFGDVCSRNHIRPGISKILLIPNFYSHYSLVQTENEHGNSALEYENSELFAHFKEFFLDIVPEMEKFGEIKQIVVCCNAEVHLRGNVYVEYCSEREALLGYRSLNGRWYAGKQLNVEFSCISSWKAAICGLFHRRKCPKGASCNFIHRFLNPRQLYSGLDERYHKSPSKSESRTKKSPRRDWRWSESPEHVNCQSDWEDGSSCCDESVSKVNSTKLDGRKDSGSDRNSHKSRRNSSSTRKRRKRSRSRSERHKKSKRTYRENNNETKHGDSAERRDSHDSRRHSSR
ncbi:U2 small nuclear ribonucleoprotein auxiliary factor 35 kDa subunit-related protein 1 [Coccinella septempunctata]|uniref:U2 small nuclear ribonucleoprotein auxiliary factor 35 kDa subunit-related protein 1 n=1 Tax=Coccinella septempunctata TaxID=41139 RepID=UPI001D07AE71|nr:U2 small nuclear ribonucleoprotein auxiliary factor 35 kDa subunit-related protein 1 [Coccinella septempunctata]